MSVDTDHMANEIQSTNIIWLLYFFYEFAFKTTHLMSLLLFLLFLLLNEKKNRGLKVYISPRILGNKFIRVD